MEHECKFEKTIEEMSADLKEIRKMLLGNGSGLGVVPKIRIMWGIALFGAISIASLVIKEIFVG